MQFDIKSWGNEIASQLGFVHPKKKRSYRRRNTQFVTYNYSPKVTYININFIIVTPNTTQKNSPTSFPVRLNAPS
jgi:hypothetical protein